MQRRANESEPTYPAAMQMFTMLRLLEEQSTRAMSVNDLAERLEVDRRTVVRYVKALGACVDGADGRPIVRRELRGGETWAVFDERDARLSKNIFQYAATYAASRHLTGRPLLGEGVDDVLDELQEGLRPSQAALVGRVRTAFHYVAFGAKDYAPQEDLLDTIVQGLLRQFTLVVSYAARHKAPEEKRLEPWTLVMYRDGLYLWSRVWRADGRSDMRLYAVDRIAAATLDRARPFEVPRDFDPGKTFSGSLGLWKSDDTSSLITLAFSAEAADLVGERQWPGFVAWREDAEGRHVLTLDVPITPEVIGWVMSWGPEVEVLGPEGLRNQVAERLRAALVRYRP